jgi:hypothetical protein
MRSHRARLIILLATLSLCGAAACDRATDIRDLLSDAERYDAREVTIHGTVKNAVRVPFLDFRVYHVDDGTGEIVVVTSGRLPSAGDEVTVKGTFRTLGSVNGQSFGPHIRVTAAK